jgi:hypothetical protein
MPCARPFCGSLPGVGILGERIVHAAERLLRYALVPQSLARVDEQRVMWAGAHDSPYSVKWLGLRKERL